MYTLYYDSHFIFASAYTINNNKGNNRQTSTTDQIDSNTEYMYTAEVTQLHNKN